MGAEKATTAALAAAAPPMAGVLTRLTEAPEVAATYHAAVKARRDLAAFMADCVQYAVDEPVMTALADRISTAFGALPL